MWSRLVTFGIYDPTAWQYELWVFTVKWMTLSIWPRQDPIICCRNPTCQDEIFSYKYSIIPARWGVFHLYKHAILFYINTPPYNQVYQQGWIKISNPLPFRYHIIRHIPWALYFTSLLVQGREMPLNGLKDFGIPGEGVIKEQINSTMSTCKALE